MARKRKTPSTQDKASSVDRGAYWLPNDAAWGGFINMRLDDAQKEDFEAWWADNSAEISRYLDDAIGQGIKFGLSYDSDHECYIATFTGALVANSNERYTCTSRAATANEVIALSVWKHVVLTEGDYGNFRPADSKFLSWG